jgi:hypothetical protein
MKDSVAESADEHVEAGQMLAAALIGQVVAAQHVLAAADIPSLKKNVQ